MTTITITAQYLDELENELVQYQFKAYEMADGSIVIPNEKSDSDVFSSRKVFISLFPDEVVSID